MFRLRRRRQGQRRPGRIAGVGARGAASYAGVTVAPGTRPTVCTQRQWSPPMPSAQSSGPVTRPAAARSSPMTSTDGPAPETTAARPCSRRYLRPSRRPREAWRRGSPGGGGPRWRPTAARGAPASAATSSAARPTLKAASRCGTCSRQHRARLLGGKHGVRNQHRRLDALGHRRAAPRGRPRGPATPPSPRPKSRERRCRGGPRTRSRGAASSRGRAARARRCSPRTAAIPATTAAADEPSPFPCGIELRATMRRPVCEDAHGVGGGANRAHDEVRLVARQRVRALALDLDLDARRAERPHLDLVGHAHRHAERVETWAQGCPRSRERVTVT